MTLEMHNKVYDVLKWLALIVLPACAVLYSALSALWGFPYAHQVSETINAVVVFIGALIGVSTANYNKQLKQTDEQKNKVGF